MAACPICGMPTCLSPSCRHLHRLRAPGTVQRRCLYCSKAAAPGQETCDEERCRKLQASQVDARARETRRREEIDRKASDLERDLRAIHGPMIRALLPANEQTVVPLSDERRAAFMSNIAAAIDRALEDPDRPVPVAPESPPGHAGMIRSACTACRGSCCKYGGDAAYLYPDHFRRLLPGMPGKSRDEILSEYRSRLPDRVYHDSCVYHTETGCALPRDLRSNLCNTFLCGGLESMLAAQPKESSPVPILALCVRDSSAEVIRTALFDVEGRSLLPTE